MSAYEEPLSPIPEELLEKYKASSTNANLTNGYNNLRIVPFQNPLLFLFTTSSPVTTRNELLDHLITLLEGTKKPFVTPNSHKPLSNKDLAAFVRNATKNVNSQLDTIHTNFQQHRCQHWTDCHDYYCKSHGSSIKAQVRDLCYNSGNLYPNCIIRHMLTKWTNNPSGICGWGVKIALKGLGIRKCVYSELRSIMYTIGYISIIFCCLSLMYYHWISLRICLRISA